MRITKYGTIKGGGCDRTHNQRFARERGSLYALNELNSQGCIKWKGNKGVIVKELSNKYNWKWLAKKYKGDEQVGWFRFVQDVVPLLIKKKMSCTWTQFKKYTKDIASFEFGVSMDGPLSIITPGEKVEWGYAPPHRDDIYKRKKKDKALR